MAEPFLGQVIITGFNFAPRGYATCDGQMLSIAQNTALFSLLGTTYGGDGSVTFALPDLRGRASINQGQGPGLTNRDMGEVSGATTYTLLNSEIPSHNHAVLSTNQPGSSNSPSTTFFAADVLGGLTPYSDSAPQGQMNAQMVGLSGGNQPHENMQPYLVVNFSIALEGIFPSRN